MLKGITQHGLLPILGLAFKAGLFIVTAINTYGILYLISQDRVWAAAGLILFEIGLIYWWLVFKNDTQASVVQMAISLMMFITCLLLVAAANALHLGAISPDMLGDGTIPKVVIMAVVAHLAASLIYPLASAEHAAALVEQIALGLIWAKAQSNVMANLDHLAEQSQVEIEDRMWRTIQGRVNQTANARLIESPEATVIEGQTIARSTPVPVRAPRPPRRTLTDRLFGRQPAPAEDSPTTVEDAPTHDAPRHDATQPAADSGQGGLPSLSDADLRRFIELLRQVERESPPAAHLNGQEVNTDHPH